MTVKQVLHLSAPAATGALVAVLLGAPALAAVVAGLGTLVAAALFERVQKRVRSHHLFALVVAIAIAIPALMLGAVVLTDYMSTAPTPITAPVVPRCWPWPPPALIDCESSLRPCDEATPIERCIA